MAALPLSPPPRPPGRLMLSVPPQNAKLQAAWDAYAFDVAPAVLKPWLAKQGKDPFPRYHCASDDKPLKKLFMDEVTTDSGLLREILSWVKHCYPYMLLFDDPVPRDSVLSADPNDWAFKVMTIMKEVDGKWVETVLGDPDSVTTIVDDNKVPSKAVAKKLHVMASEGQQSGQVIPKQDLDAAYLTKGNPKRVVFDQWMAARVYQRAEQGVPTTLMSNTDNTTQEYYRDQDPTFLLQVTTEAMKKFHVSAPFVVKQIQTKMQSGNRKSWRANEESGSDEGTPPSDEGTPPPPAPAPAKRAPPPPAPAPAAKGKNVMATGKLMPIKRKALAEVSAGDHTPPTPKIEWLERKENNAMRRLNDDDDGDDTDCTVVFSRYAQHKADVVDLASSWTDEDVPARPVRKHPNKHRVQKKQKVKPDHAPAAAVVPKATARIVAHAPPPPPPPPAGAEQQVFEHVDMNDDIDLDVPAPLIVPTSAPVTQYMWTAMRTTETVTYFCGIKPVPKNQLAVGVNLGPLPAATQRLMRLGVDSPYEWVLVRNMVVKEDKKKKSKRSNKKNPRLDKRVMDNEQSADKSLWNCCTWSGKPLLSLEELIRNSKEPPGVLIYLGVLKELWELHPAEEGFAPLPSSPSFPVPLVDGGK